MEDQENYYVQFVQKTDGMLSYALHADRVRGQQTGNERTGGCGG